LGTPARSHSGDTGITQASHRIVGDEPVL
jgi:hypothetical protein